MHSMAGKKSNNKTVSSVRCLVTVLLYLGMQAVCGGMEAVAVVMQ